MMSNRINFSRFQSVLRLAILFSTKERISCCHFIELSVYEDGRKPPIQLDGKKIDGLYVNLHTCEYFHPRISKPAS